MKNLLPATPAASAAPYLLFLSKKLLLLVSIARGVYFVTINCFFLNYLIILLFLFPYLTDIFYFLRLTFYFFYSYDWVNLFNLTWLQAPKRRARYKAKGFFKNRYIFRNLKGLILVKRRRFPHPSSINSKPSKGPLLRLLVLFLPNSLLSSLQRFDKGKGSGPLAALAALAAFAERGCYRWTGGEATLVGSKPENILKFILLIWTFLRKKIISCIFVLGLDYWNLYNYLSSYNLLFFVEKAVGINLSLYWKDSSLNFNNSQEPFETSKEVIKTASITPSRNLVQDCGQLDVIEESNYLSTSRTSSPFSPLPSDPVIADLVPKESKEPTSVPSSPSNSHSSLSPSPSSLELEPCSPSTKPQNMEVPKGGVVSDGNNQTKLKGSNFHSLSQSEKFEYIKNKFYNKGIEHNLPYLDWFIQKTNQTDGSLSSVNMVIDSNLNAILKIEREAKLNSHSFKTIKPFLINKNYNSPTQFPITVPFKTSNNLED